MAISIHLSLIASARDADGTAPAVQQHDSLSSLVSVQSLEFLLDQDTGQDKLAAGGARFCVLSAVQL